MRNYFASFKFAFKFYRKIIYIKYSIKKGIKKIIVKIMYFRKDINVSNKIHEEKFYSI